MKQDLERKLLSELMAAGTSFDAFIEMAPEIDEKIFLESKNRYIYSAIKGIYQSTELERIDFETLIATMDARKTLDFGGGAGYISRLDDPLSGAYATTTAKMLIEVYHKDRIRKLCERTIEVASNGRAPEEIAEKMIDEMQRIIESGKTDQTVTLSRGIKKIREEYAKNERRKTIPTGIASLDRHLAGGGFAIGDYIVIGARPSVGKSNVAFNFMVNMTAQGYRVGLISAEMDIDSVLERTTATVGNFDDDRLRSRSLNSQEEKAFMSACDILEKRNAVISDAAGISITEIGVLAKKWKREHKIDILLIDYLQYISPTKTGKYSNRERDIASMSTALKTIGRKLNIPVIVLAQLNRHAANKEIPQLSDLRESGQIEQDGDVIILLHSFEDAGERFIPAPFANGNDGIPSEGLVLLSIQKQRKGKKKVHALVRFDKTTGRMTSIDTKHSEQFATSELARAKMESILYPSKADDLPF
jgi:replicative DNA helicase